MTDSSSRGHQGPEDGADKMWTKIHENSRRLDKLETQGEYAQRTIGQLTDGHQSLSLAMNKVSETVIGVDKKLDVYVAQQTATQVAYSQANRAASKWLQWAVPILLTIILSVMAYHTKNPPYPKDFNHIEEKR